MNRTIYINLIIRRIVTIKSFDIWQKKMQEYAHRVSTIWLEKKNLSPD